LESVLNETLGANVSNIGIEPAQERMMMSLQ